MKSLLRGTLIIIIIINNYYCAEPQKSVWHNITSVCVCVYESIV